MTELKKKPLFNPEGDPDVRLRRMIDVYKRQDLDGTHKRGADHGAAAGIHHGGQHA